MRIRAARGQPFARSLSRQSPESPPFLNSSSNHPLGCAPSPATPYQASHTGYPQLSLETHPSTVLLNHVTVTDSSFLNSYTASSSSLIVSSARPTPVSIPFTNASTAQGGSPTAADVPWTTVIWFPPMSASKTAAIVAATVVPVMLILVGALFLSRFLWRWETAKSSELAVASHPQSANRGAGCASNAGYERISQTITRSRGLSVGTPATEQRFTADSISLRNVPQGIYECHLSDLSFLLDGSEPSDSSDDLGDGDGSSIADSRYDRGFLASRESAGRQPYYYIPSSILDLASVGQEFEELNKRFGLQV